MNDYREPYIPLSTSLPLSEVGVAHALFAETDATSVAGWLSFRPGRLYPTPGWHSRHRPQATRMYPNMEPFLAICHRRPGEPPSSFNAESFSAWENLQPRSGASGVLSSGVLSPPANARALVPGTLAAEGVILRHHSEAGTDVLDVVIYLHPLDYLWLGDIPAPPPKLSVEAWCAIGILAYWMSPARGVRFASEGLGVFSSDNPHVQELVQAGLARVNRRKHVSCTPLGKQWGHSSSLERSLAQLASATPAERAEFLRGRQYERPLGWEQAIWVLKSWRECSDLPLLTEYLFDDCWRLRQGGTP